MNGNLVRKYNNGPSHYSQSKESSSVSNGGVQWRTYLQRMWQGTEIDKRVLTERKKRIVQVIRHHRKDILHQML